MKKNLKLVFLMLVSVIFISSCVSMHSDSYWTKQGKKWNNYTNGQMKCKNNANPTYKFKS